MREMRRIHGDGFVEFSRITANAYPGWKVDDLNKLASRLKEQEDNDSSVRYWAMYEGDLMLGGLRIHDFTMNFVGIDVRTGGIGLVAVDLLRKKEKIARDIVLFCLHHFREKKAPLSVLYPFRPDFYRQMGWGYGTRNSQYKVKPANLPKGPTREHVVYLGKAEKQAVLDCYNTYYRTRHGFIKKTFAEAYVMMENPNARVIGVKRDGRLEGYAVFGFRNDKEGRFLVNDIVVHEMVYLTKEALMEMMTFLNAQADQIREMIFNTQDDYFHYLLRDPRNGTDNLIPPVAHETNTQGLGLMYRVNDTKGVFEALSAHDFNGVTFILKLSLADSLLPENGGPVVVRFVDGRAAVAADDASWDAEVRMDISDFSSMLVGAVPFRALHEYSLASISDERFISLIDRAFRTTERPACVTSF